MYVMSRQGSQAYSLNKILSPISQRKKIKIKIHQQWIKIKNIFWKHKKSLQTVIPQKQISPLWPGKRLTIIYSSWSVWGSSEITVFVIMVEMICRKKTPLKCEYERDKIKIQFRYIFGFAPVIFWATLQQYIYVFIYMYVYRVK